MEIVRVFTGADGQSHFEDVAVDLQSYGPMGSLSDLWPGKGLQFREVTGDYTSTFTTPRADNSFRDDERSPVSRRYSATWF